MNNGIKRMIVKLLDETNEKIQNGSCDMTEEEAMEIMKVLAHRALSKDQACSYLNMSRSKFDQLVKEGKLPKGRKRRGFKELVFYQDELTEYIKQKE